MSTPNNEPPDDCPRRVGGGMGPRACPFAGQCRYHLRQPGERGPVGKRVRLMVLSDDSCARDVQDRVMRDGVTLSYRELGVLLGTSKQAAQQSVKRALRKFSVRMRRVLSEKMR